MRRRDFITFLGGTTAWVATARAEEPRHVIAHLSGRFGGLPGALEAFYQGLKEIGFIEGRNISIELHWAHGHYDRLPSLAAELVGHNVSVIGQPTSHRRLLQRRRPKRSPLSSQSAATRSSWVLSKA
jgi:putative ABC transport system substrate-binding protein